MHARNRCWLGVHFAPQAHMYINNFKQARASGHTAEYVIAGLTRLGVAEHIGEWWARLRWVPECNQAALPLAAWRYVYVITPRARTILGHLAARAWQAGRAHE